MVKQMQAVNNVDNNPFFTNEQTISHQPEKIIIDFKSALPQFISNEPMMVLNHRVIIMDPYMTKLFLSTLQDNLSKYESTYGKIKKSEQLIKGEKDALKEATTTAAVERPDYLG